ncbi:Serine/threonine-protein kinase KSP1 [Pseudozyma hubeiensis]|nr:Serine/threonine-protein kinase KSP1 [Pseudozyma hubeiensis]
MNATEGNLSLLSTSLKREKNGMLDADWVPGHHPHPDPKASHAIKPSGIGNGVIGRAPEFGTSPTKPKGANLPSARHHWPLSSSLENSSSAGPATHLPPLRIEPNERSRFFPSASTPFKPNQKIRSGPPPQQSLQTKDRDDDWMLTPTSSLPSIPSTPNRLRETSTERVLAGMPQLGAQPGIDSRPPPSIRGPVEQFQATLQSAPRIPSPGHGFARSEAGLTGASLFNRGPSVNILSSPKRSPLVVSAYPHRQQAGNSAANPVILSPTSSPKLAHRALSPVTRYPPVIPESPVHSSTDRVVNSIASMLSGASPQPRPGSVSRRESFNSVASAGAGHMMSHSRRSSAVFSPNSPTVATRVGVYRPPHLRNRDSVSGLRPSVAHYDRVRTPSLRGLSRSRESSMSLSRPTSRPPSTVSFYHAESIPEDVQADDAAPTPLRGRQSTASIHLPGLIAEEQQRNAAAAAAASGSESGQVATFVPNTTHLLEQPLDSASLLAKLRAQLVRREAAASDAAASDMDQESVITDDNEQDFFDLSDMMEYGASEGHPLSRYGSTYAIEGRPLGDVFEIGDLLGPGLEHDGHTIKIAETTPGFVDQNEDLTGSKLEVVRKLGEGSYAVVYLVKEVSADEAASYALQKSMAIPASSSRNTASEASTRNPDDDADLTMVASSEDLLSSTLKANGKGKDAGFHNSPALEERRRKDLKIDTRLRPGKEFALKCLCKRDLPEDMLEVQRLEATIHQSIPAHPNIVTLYRTYETPDWLFLVLEYCPGQDLYFWLEQAQDEGQPLALERENGVDTHADNDDDADAKSNGASSASNDDNYRLLGSSLDATPPSPSLLASTSGHGLLSKRRIRLIARMFRQICDAVQFCHDRGVSHRDIKPENFIVEDRRTVEEMQSVCPDTSASTLVDGSRDGDEAQVIVKMTDFGLATAEDRCDDFDCGSKPYMAFECHNNISSSYDPKQADIWSLGVVLLNLLFHRSPFTEPSTSCPSFAAYCQDPIRFLMESFDGLTETVARFLSENVFCSVTDDDDATQRRISAGEFSRWACGLVDHMGLSGSGPRRISRGASVYSTIPLVHSRTASMSTLPSLLSSPRPRARSLARDTDHIADLDVTADATFRAAFAAARQGGLSPYSALFTPDVLPSPTFTPSPQPPDRNPFDSQYGAAEEAACRAEGIASQEKHENPGHLHRDVFRSSSSSAETKPHELDPSGPGSKQTGSSTSVSNDNEGHKDVRQALASPGDASNPSDETLLEDRKAPQDRTQDNARRLVDGEGTVRDPVELDEAAGGAGDAAGDGVDEDKAESVATSNHSKRRKRGARKGRTLAKQLKRSQSVEGMADGQADDPASKARERERTIRELALASENLARQMSKMAKPSDAVDGVASPQVTLSKPTAEAAARFNLQGLTDAEAESAMARGAKPADDAPAANWSSAAVRRERMGEHRKTGVAPLADPGRSKVMSWRERNQSAATLSSLASSATSTSSHSSLTSATSSIYSTASAPAALTRKDFSSRNRTRGSGFGLDTISEREKTAPTKKEVDAKYLAGIFGGGHGGTQDKKRKEEAPRVSSSIDAVTPAAVAAQVATSPIEKGDNKNSKLFGLLSDGTSGGMSSKANGGVRSASASAAKPEDPSPRLAAIEAGSNGAAQRSVSVGSTTSNSSSSGVAASFVSRFRRPTSSSSSTTTGIKGAVGSEVDNAGSGGQAQTLGPYGQAGGNSAMRRDASTSTSSLHRVTQSGSTSAAPDVAPTKSNGSTSSIGTKSNDATGTDASGAGTVAPATSAAKKRGMGKFLLGVRDSIKNF